MIHSGKRIARIPKRKLLRQVSLVIVKNMDNHPPRLLRGLPEVRQVADEADDRGWVPFGHQEGRNRYADRASCVMAISSPDCYRRRQPSPKSPHGILGFFWHGERV